MVRVVASYDRVPATVAPLESTSVRPGVPGAMGLEKRAETVVVAGMALDDRVRARGSSPMSGESSVAEKVTSTK